MIQLKEGMMFKNTLDRKLGLLLIKGVFATAFTLMLIAFVFDQMLYAKWNAVVVGICVALFALYQRGYLQVAFWWGTVSLSLIMVYYTYLFGYVNTHLYLLSGAIILAYFARGTKYASEIIWIVVGILFLFCNFLLRYLGKIPELTELEGLLFYPNILGSIVLFYLGTSLYKKKQYEQKTLIKSSIASKEKLLSLLSHDLRTPFNNLHGIIELIELEIVSEKEVSQSVSDIKSNLNASQSMLDNLLLWSETQLEAEKPIHIEKFSIQKIIEETIDLHRGTAVMKGITLQSTVEDVEIETDVELFNSIVRNIISNAIKFSPKNTGVVEVSLDQHTDSYCLSITDNGMGISEEKLNGLFSTIETTNGTNNEVGFGIGLQLVYDLCKQLSIDIKVDSKLGEWTKFSLTLPKN